MKQKLAFYSLYISWLLSLLATFGSLYFSEIGKFPPCNLCWYQRILMYPLSIILLVGIIKKDKVLPYYALPLSILGTIIAGYHSLLQWKILTESVAPCAEGVSCTTVQLQYFGFVTIPFMSFLAFISITGLMLYHLKATK